MRLKLSSVIFLGVTLTMALSLGISHDFAFAESPNEIVAKDGVRFRKSGKSGFYTVISPKGEKVPDLVDEVFVKFYTSPESNPNQKSLDALLAKVDQVRLYDCGFWGDELMGGKKVLDISQWQDIAQFRQQLKIVEDERTFGHCMCLGEPTIELLQEKKHLAYIGCQHGAGIRWNKWKWDAQLQDGKALASWFAAQGYDKQLKEMEEQEKARDLARKNYEKWLKAAPRCLSSDVLAKLSSSEAGWVTFAGRNERHQEAIVLTGQKAELVRLLDRDTRNKQKSVALLLNWAGNGVSQWQGSPAYEELVFALLDGYAMADFYHVLREPGMTGEVLEGACHYTSRLTQRLTNKFPADVKKLLYSYMAKDKDLEKVRSLKKALGKN